MDSGDPQEHGQQVISVGRVPGTAVVLMFRDGSRWHVQREEVGR